MSQIPNYEQTASFLGDALHMDPNETVKGAIIEGHDITVAPNLPNLLGRSTTMKAALLEGSKLIGYSFAIPSADMDPDREEREPEVTDLTAYVYGVAIEAARRGQGLVASLMAKMHTRILLAGFTHLELDAMVDNGYAASVTRAYGPAVEQRSAPHNKYGLGWQRFFRINLVQYQRSLLGLHEDRLLPSILSGDLETTGITSDHREDPPSIKGSLSANAPSDTVNSRQPAYAPRS